MKTIVVGAGTVGENIAQLLMREGHEVVVMDLDPRKIGPIEEELDVQTYIGNACNPKALREVGIGSANLLLAVTESDETNLICSYTAKQMGCVRVIARVRARHYFEDEQVNYRQPLGIDRLISPEVSTANELASFIGNPSALASATLASGKVHIRTVRLDPKSEFAGKTVMKMAVPNGALIAGIRRGSEVMIAHGATVLEGDDRVTLIGLPEVLDNLTRSFDLAKAETHRSLVAIGGATETGLVLAEQLENRGHRVILIEESYEAARAASERLAKAEVLHGDATEIDFLREERIGRANYFAAVTGDDENNIMSSLQAKELGVEKTACLIGRPDYARVVEKIGIDVAISPRLVVANKVLGMVKRGRIQSVTLLEDGEMEVYEYRAIANSAIVGQKLMEAAIPRDSIIGAVVSGGQVTIPRGDYVIKPGSVAICVTRPESAEKLDDLFAERKSKAEEKNGA